MRGRSIVISVFLAWSCTRLEARQTCVVWVRWWRYRTITWFWFLSSSDFRYLQLISSFVDEVERYVHGLGDCSDVIRLRLYFWNQLPVKRRRYPVRKIAWSSSSTEIAAESASEVSALDLENATIGIPFEFVCRCSAFLSISFRRACSITLFCLPKN